jgi:hypothetical protein
MSGEGIHAPEDLRVYLFDVGASLLTMIVNDCACFLTKHVSFKSIASKLAPTLRAGWQA